MAQMSLQPAAIREASSDAQKRVLLVERCPLNRHLESLILRRAGFTVQEAGSAVQALRLLRVLQYGAIVVDPDLPDENGPRLLRRLRQQSMTSSLVVVSGRAFPAERSLALDAGCDAYIVKPICTRTFGSDVEAAIARRAERPARAAHA